MATIDLKDGNLIVRIHGWDVVLALRSTLTIPLAHFWMTGGTAHAGQQHALEQLNTASKDLEGLTDSPQLRVSEVRAHIDAASALKHSLHEAGAPELARYLAFDDVHKPEKSIGLDVEYGRLRRVVVEVEDETPEACAARIRAVLG